MKIFATMFVVLALAIPMGGCATLDKLVNVNTTVSTYTVKPSDMVIARQSFNAVEIAATQYLSLKRCDGSNVVCRSPAVTPDLIQAIRRGRVARNNITQFVKDHPGQLGPTGLYDAVVSATSTIQSVLATAKPQ